jgi:putative DNA primase/helicase
MIAGDAKTGKSLIACRIAATISRGGKFPFEEGEAMRGHVIIINPEDDPRSILRPRLEAAGADLKRIHIPEEQWASDSSALIESLRRELPKVPYLRAVILDPITALCSVSRNNSDQVRQFLTQLGALAAKNNIAIVAIVHLNKNKAGRASTRIAGSFEWMAACRSAFLVTDGTGTDPHLFLPLPNNIGLKREGLAFRIVEGDTKDGERAPRVKWLNAVSISADEALARGMIKESATMSEATEFLLQTVTKPMPAKEVLELGKEAGFSPKELRTARKNLGIETNRDGGLGSEGWWTWFPPATAK